MDNSNQFEDFKRQPKLKLRRQAEKPKWTSKVKIKGGEVKIGVREYERLFSYCKGDPVCELEIKLITSTNKQHINILIDEKSIDKIIDKLVERKKRYKDLKRRTI